MAAAGQLVRLVLRGADSLSDFSAATLLGPYAWNKLTHLEIEGAQVRTASRLYAQSNAALACWLRDDVDGCDRVLGEAELACFVRAGIGSALVPLA